MFAVYFLAAATPGPAQFFILERMLGRSHHDARWAALGVSAGTFVWVIFVVWGLRQFVSYVPGARLVTAWMAVALLVFFAIRNLRMRGVESGADGVDASRFRISVSARSSFVQGLLVNLLNPNSVVFFMTLFAPLVSGNVSARDLNLSVLGVLLISVLWYQVIAESWRFRSFYILLKSQASRLRVVIAILYVFWALRLVHDFDLFNIQGA